MRSRRLLHTHHPTHRLPPCGADFPWMAYIESPLGVCGGSLVAPGYVLTAASCVWNSTLNVTIDAANVSLWVAGEWLNVSAVNVSASETGGRALLLPALPLSVARRATRAPPLDCSTAQLLSPLPHTDWTNFDVPQANNSWDIAVLTLANNSAAEWVGLPTSDVPSIGIVVEQTAWEEEGEWIE